MSVVGYARASTSSQDPAGQHEQLQHAGAETIYTDVASGARADRPQLTACQAYLRPGDVLVVARLDRLGRSLAHLIEIVEDLRAGDVGLRSLGEGIDTTTAAGRMVLHVFGAIAEFERELIRERTRVGLDAARRQGRSGGRPTVMTPERLKIARQLRHEGQSLRSIASTLGVSRSTLARHLA